MHGNGRIFLLVALNAMAIMVPRSGWAFLRESFDKGKFLDCLVAGLLVRVI